MGDLGTIFFSDSVDSLGGTLPWMSPELLNSLRPGSDICPSHESDCYALGMVIYEVNSLYLSRWFLVDDMKFQVLTGRQPFYGLSALQIVVAIAEGGLPGKPLDTACLGFSTELWELTQSCWGRPASGRPTAQRLLDYLSGTTHDWVPPSTHPIPEPDTDSNTSSCWGMTSGDSVSEI